MLLELIGRNAANRVLVCLAGPVDAFRRAMATRRSCAWALQADALRDEPGQADAASACTRALQWRAGALQGSTAWSLDAGGGRKMGHEEGTGRARSCSHLNTITGVIGRHELRAASSNRCA